jgi:hypothetical protein
MLRILVAFLSIVSAARSLEAVNILHQDSPGGSAGEHGNTPSAITSSSLTGEHQSRSRHRGGADGPSASETEQLIKREGNLYRALQSLHTAEAWLSMVRAKVLTALAIRKTALGLRKMKTTVENDIAANEKQKPK